MTYFTVHDMSHLSFYVHGTELYLPYVWQMEINSFSENNFTVSPVSVLRNSFLQEFLGTEFFSNKSYQRVEREEMNENQKDFEE